MEKMSKAFEKVKIMVGMEVEDEEQQAAALDNDNSFAFMDEFNRNCTLSTKQVFNRRRCLFGFRETKNEWAEKRRENFIEISWFCDVESGYARFWTWIYTCVVVFDIAILRHLILRSCRFRSSGVLIFWSDLFDEKL